MAAHLHECFFLAAKFHRLRADEFLVLLAELGLLGFKRHILLAEQLDLDLRVPIEDLVARFRQLRAQRMTDISPGELELAGLESRLHVLNEMQVGLLRLRVIRVAGHGDVALGGLLVNRGVELAPVQQPTLQAGGGGARLCASFKLVEERSDLAPVSQVNCLWQKAAGFMRRQRVKWQ